MVAANAGGVTVAGSTTNSIVLTGTLANINTYLATVANQPTYTPTLNYNGTDTLTMLTNDGGNTGGGALTDSDPVTINITAVNDPPVLSNLAGDSSGYAIGSGAQIVDQGAAATALDPDVNYNGGNLTVSLAAGGVNAEDILAIRNQGMGAGQIGAAAGTVYYSGVAIGTYVGGTAGANLVITLNAAADNTAVTALMQNITFQNTNGSNPIGGDRTVRFVLTDNAAATSGNIDATVTVQSLTVDTASDVSDGNTSSLAALWANKGADGKISLREAIAAANASAGSDTIRFQIGTGAQTINIASALPIITDTIIIDGTTQSGYVAGIFNPISLDGGGVAINGLALSNAATGSTIKGLVIGNFNGHGLMILNGSNNNVIQGNFIGSFDNNGNDLGAGGNSANGIIILAATGNTIGGATAAQRNLIGGNNLDGIDLVGSTSNTIQGNYIGTDVTGTGGVGNNKGILLSSGATSNIITGNLISGNVGSGIELGALGANSSNTISSNLIGTTITGTTALANTGDGIRVGFGGTANNAIISSNTIAFNGGDGISLIASTSVRIQTNLIFSNTGLGIDLTNDGVTLNDLGDADTGANNLQNFPVITSVVFNGANLAITGTFNSNASTSYSVEFFGNPAGNVDASGHGEARVYLGVITFTTDASGNASFSTTVVPSGLVVGDFVTATARRLGGGGGDTSEFALNTIISPNTAPVISSNGGGATAAVSVTALTTAVTTVTASDAGGLAATPFSFGVGPDNGFFTLNTTTGVLTFTVPPALGATPDFNGDGVYQVTIIVTDAGGLTDTQQIFVSVIAAPGVGTPNATGNPLITGTVTENQTLTATNGTIADANGIGAFNYQWFRDASSTFSASSVAIAGATHSTYTLGNADVGQYMFVRVVYQDGGGNLETLVSAATTQVAGVNDAPSFNVGTGSLIQVIGAADDVGNSVAVQVDGKILVAGYSDSATNKDFAITRYNADGSLDTSFGTAGIAIIAVGTGDDFTTSIVLQNDGKILVAGYARVGGNYDFALVRLNSNGTLDGTFGTAGKVTTPIGAAGDIANNVVLQADGKILLVGASFNGSNDDFAVVRYTAAGVLDTSFGAGNGIAITAIGAGNDSAQSVIVQNDGRIVVAGNSFNGSNNDFAVVRYTTAGTLDTTFGTTGIITADVNGSQDVAYSVALQQDGKIVVAGYSANGSNNDFSLVRYNANGILDGTFGTGGKVVTTVGTGDDLGYSLVVQSDGAIVVAGYAFNGTDNDVALVRYTSSGALDATFGVGGKVITSVAADQIGYNLQLQSDGKLVLAGYSDNGTDNDFSLLRYNTNGTLDTQFNLTGTTLGGVRAFTEGAGAALGTAVVLDGNVTLFDAELSAANNFNGATLTLVRNGGTNVDDVFSGLGGFAAIGTVTTNSGGTLLITLNSFATNALLNTAMQQITYANSSQDPPASVQIDWSFDDGNAGAQGTGAGVATGSVTVNITAVNDTPINNVPASYTTDEDITLALTGLSITDVDARVGSLTVTLTVTNGTLTVSGGSAGIAGSGTSTVTLTGTITAINATLAATVNYVPTANYNGSATLTMGVNDGGNTGTGGAKTDSDVINITINSVNDAPAGTNKTITFNEDAAYTFSAADFGFSDVNDAPNTFSAVTITTLPLLGVLTLGGVPVLAGDSIPVGSIGTLVYTPVADANGAAYASFTFQVQDNGGTANSGVDIDPTPNTITFNVTAVNDAPINTVPGAQSTNEDITLAITGLSIVDVDAAASSVTVTLIVTNGTLTVSGGTAGIAGSGTSTVTLTGTVTQINATLAATVNYVPTANYNGSATLTMGVNDGGNTGTGGAKTDSDVINITINSVNDAPAGTNKTITTLEDTAYTFTVADFGFSDVNDAPNTLLNVRITTLPLTGSLTLTGFGAVTAGQFVLATDIAAGKLIYTPVTDANGLANASFTFQVQDNGGTAFSGIDLDPSANTISIDVTSVNDAPIGTNNTVTTNEDTVYTFAVADFGFTDPNDTPTNSMTGVRITTLPTAGTLTLTGVGAVTAGQIITVANITAGKLIFTPALNANGVAYSTFTFQVQDNGGVASGGVNQDTTARTMTIDVTAVNDAPINNGLVAQTTNEDTSKTITGLSITDVDAASASITTTLSVLNGVLNVSGGTATITNSGTNTVTLTGTVAQINATLAATVSYVPTANYNGSDTLTMVTSDNGNTGSGGTLTDTDAVSITINSVNDAPSGTDNTISTNEDTAQTFTVADFGFSDVIDSNSLTGVRITTLPLTGSLTLSGVAVTAGQTITLANITGGNLKFTPAANANGLANASFTFQVQDSGGTAFGGVDLDPSANTMTIDVNSVNDAPTGTNNTITTNEDTAHTFTLAEFGFADSLDSPANNAFQVKITTLPALGSLKLNGVAVTAGQFVLVSDITSGLLVYTPALNGNSAAYTSFTFQVQDDGGTALGGIDLDPVDNTITINVTAVNDAPVITNGSTVTLTGTNEDTTSSGTLVSTILAAAGYSDVDVSALSGIAIIGKMRNGSFEYSTDGISWRNFGAAPLSTSSALLLTSGTQIRYIPDQQNGETATLTFQAWDQTTDTASDNATPRYGNITGSGGTAAYSTGIATISITVNDLNDAPLLNSGFVYNLPGTDENTPNDAVLIKVSDILSAPGSGYSDVDTGSSLSYGIAVTGAFRNGSFQYSTDGTTWTSGVLNSATPANALLLDSSTYIRYVPDGKNGEIAATFTFRVWDRTVGTASNFGTQSYANASSTGLTFAFSANTGTASVAVSDVPDAPVIGSDGGLATASINAFDDTNAVTTVIATDVDIGSTLTFSKAGGVDASFFNLDPNTGVLTFISIPDSFNPLDSNADNVYHVVVQVIDNTGLIDTQSIAVTVVPTTNKAPVIDNNGGGTTGGGATASVNFAENTATAVATVHATDPDALDTVTYSISGADAALFTINPTTGVLTFNSPPDFENKLDNDSNNSYIVTVTATDNGSPNRRDTQIITINVTPVNDNAPVMISSATFTMSENSVDVTPILTANKTIEATDADLDVRTYSIVGGVDASKFTLNSATGHLSFVIAPDFEAPTDVGINNVYNLTVQASDGTFNTTQNITVTVLNGNDAPVAVNDASSGNAGTAQSGAVLGNDSDQDTNALVAVLATGPAHGSVTLNANGTYTYTPTPGFSGSDSFTYRATDGALNSNLATVSLTVVFVAPIIPIIPPPPPLPPVPTPTPTAITPPLESDIQTQRALLEAEQKPKEESLISANEGQAVTQVVVGSGVVIEAPKTNNNTSTDLTTTPIQLVDANLAKNQANGLNGAFGSLSGNKIIIESVNLLGGLETEGGNGEQGILSKLSLQKQVQLSGTAASLGLVFWALNSGAIISSVVASSPSWTDPISLLDDSDAEVPDEDEDENTANSEEGAADMLSQ
ncbi:MAG: beta strand repeat-containing protein [Methylophilaceae bacterium]